MPARSTAAMFSVVPVSLKQVTCRGAIFQRKLVRQSRSSMGWFSVTSKGVTRAPRVILALPPSTTRSGCSSPDESLCCSCVSSERSRDRSLRPESLPCAGTTHLFALVSGVRLGKSSLLLRHSPQRVRCCRQREVRKARPLATPSVRKPFSHRPLARRKEALLLR